MPNQFNSPEGDLENYFVSEYWLIDQYVGDQLWGWGLNSTNGRVGNNSPTGSGSISTPVTTSAGGSNWKQISTAFSGSSAIKTDGTLWVWGSNGNTQLGGFVGAQAVSGRTSVCTPITTFGGGTNWKQCSSGGYSTAAIKTDGTLWTWGAGSSGELGNNVTTAGASNRCTPVTTFLGGNNWKQVSCGTQFMAAIKTDGTLWTWGNNSGNLGDNTLGTKITPVTTFVGGTNWKSVNNGFQRTSAIKTDGTLWVWGLNTFAQLGILSIQVVVCTPVTTFAGGTNWKQVSGGLFTSHAITSGTDPTSFVS